MAVALRQRGNSYSAYWREDGKVKEKSLGSNMRLARIEMAAIEKRLDDKKNGAEKEILWEDYVARYMNFCETNMAPATVVRVRVVFSNIRKFMPLRNLRDMTPEFLEEYKLTRKNAGIEPSTINREIVTVKSSMKSAAQWGYALPNIWGVRKMPTVKKRPVFFTHEEVDKLLAAADPLWQMAIRLGVFLGLRRGEMLNLRWEDIDFQNDIVRIKPNEEWHPKDREEREIPLHPELKSHMNRWRAACKNDEQRVIPWYYKVIAFSQAFSRIIQRAGVNKGSLHTLRHTFASHLAMAGVDLLRIGRMMGHSTVVTTQIYAHLLPSSLKEAMTYMPKFGTNGLEHSTSAPVTNSNQSLAATEELQEISVETIAVG